VSIHWPGAFGWMTAPAKVTTSPPIADEDRVLGEELVDLVGKAKRVNRAVLGAELRQSGFDGLLFEPPQLLQPLLSHARPIVLDVP
jgi:hypothetical protein